MGFNRLYIVHGCCIYSIYRWVHEYQDACINKLESFLRGLVKSLPDTMCPQKSLPSPGGLQSPGSLQSPTIVRSPSSPSGMERFRLVKADTMDMPKPADWTDCIDDGLLFDVR